VISGDCASLTAERHCLSHCEKLVDIQVDYSDWSTLQEKLSHLGDQAPGRLSLSKWFNILNATSNLLIKTVLCQTQCSAPVCQHCMVGPDHHSAKIATTQPKKFWIWPWKKAKMALFACIWSCHLPESTAPPCCSQTQPLHTGFTTPSWAVMLPIWEYCPAMLLSDPTPTHRVHNAILSCHAAYLRVLPRHAALRPNPYTQGTQRHPELSYRQPEPTWDYCPVWNTVTKLKEYSTFALIYNHC
jgi:hypothetical protein